MSPRITGILLMMTAMVFFTLLDATAKHLVQSLPPLVAVFGRYLVALGLSLAVILRKGETIQQELGVLVPMPEDEQRINQAIRKRLPYVNLWVELDEQPFLLVIANLLEAAPEEAAIGRAVEVVFQSISDQVTRRHE